MALGVVRGAQGRDGEAEQLLKDSVNAFAESGMHYAELQALEQLTAFLRARGRLDEGEPYDERMRELTPGGAGAAQVT